MNKVILSGLKKRLDDAKGKWVEELPHVLWTYRTTPRRSTGETPFLMTYGAEAVIPLEFGFPTTRTSSFSPKDNDEQLARNLDPIEEKRENAMVQLAHYQQKLKCVMLTLMLGGVWVRREERADGDTEIQRTRREKRTEVPNSGERNFRGKKGWNNFFFFFLEYCYSTILKLELYCSTIAKKFCNSGVYNSLM